MDRDTIFISHATPHDNDFVRWLGERLTARGYAVWADVFHLKGGTPFWTSIEEVLRKRAVKVIFVVSSHSIDADRSGVRNELSVADGLRKSLKDPEFIVPLRIDGTPFDELPIQIHQLNTLDFSRDWDVGLPDLLDTLEYARVPRTSDEPNGLRGAAPASAISVVNKLTGDPDEVVDAPAEGHSPAALERPSVARASPSLAPSLPDKPSVAVMPFANLGGGPDEAGLIEGLVDDIITELSRFKTFAVVGVRDPAVDARRAMRDLGVRYVLEGSVRRAGGSLRVAAHLADAATGEQLWAERFDDTATGVLFDLQDRITEAVVGLLEPQIRQAEVERVRRKRPESLDAYELFLRALPFVYGMNPDGYAEGIALLEQGDRDQSRLRSGNRLRGLVL